MELDLNTATSPWATGGLVTNVEVKGTVSVQGDDAAVQDSDISVAGANSYAVELRHANNVTIRNNNLHGPVQTPYPDYCDNGIRDIYGGLRELDRRRTTTSGIAPAG